MAAGLGVINWWGFTPALDLQAVGDGGLAGYLDGRGAGEPVNILVVGAGDCRHVLKTLAHARRHVPPGEEQERPVHLYVVESSPELVARQLLQLSIVMEPPEVCALHDCILCGTVCMHLHALQDTAYTFILLD